MKKVQTFHAFHGGSSREFKAAMRKADTPEVRLATCRSVSMPHLHVSKSIKVIQKAKIGVEIRTCETSLLVDNATVNT